MQRECFIEYLNRMLSPNPEERPELNEILSNEYMQEFLLMLDSEAGVSEDNFQKQRMWYIDFTVKSQSKESVKNYQVQYALELFYRKFGISIHPLYFSSYLNQCMIIVCKHEAEELTLQITPVAGCDIRFQLQQTQQQIEMSNILVAKIVYVFLDSSFLYVAKDFRPKRAIRQLRSAIKNITPGNRHAILGQLILLVKFFHDKNLAINNINYKSIFKVPVDPEFLRSPEREQYIQIRLYDAFFAFQNGLRFSQDI